MKAKDMKDKVEQYLKDKKINHKSVMFSDNKHSLYSLVDLMADFAVSLHPVSGEVKIKRAEITFALNRLQADKVHKLVDEIIELLSPKT